MMILQYLPRPRPDPDNYRDGIGVGFKLLRRLRSGPVFVPRGLQVRVPL